MSRSSLFSASPVIAKENANRSKKRNLSPGRRKVGAVNYLSCGVEDFILGHALKDAEIFAQHGPVKHIVKDGQPVIEDDGMAKKG